MEKKVILITGASSGIGKSAARELAEAGHIVYGAARRVDQMEDLRPSGVGVIALDVTDHPAIEKAVDQILEEQGRIDVLINNAGYGLYGAVEDISIEEARYQFEVNLFGLAQLTKSVLPPMREQGSGRIINISSVGGKIYTLLGAWYHATKHALEGWSDSLRLELKPHGIDVVLIEPGAIDTNFDEVMAGPMKERSGQGAYAEQVDSVVRGLERFYTPENSSPPEVVSHTIQKAVEARRPRTRYATGKFSRPLIFLRWLLSDRMFDRMLGAF